MIDKNDPRLTAFVLGELAELERQKIEAAIQSSPELQAAIDEIQLVCDSVQESFVDELTDQTTSTISLVKKDSGLTTVSRRKLAWVNWVAACSIAILGCSIAMLLLVENWGTFAINLRGGIEYADNSPRSDLMLPDPSIFVPGKYQDEGKEDEVDAFVPNLSLIVGVADEMGDGDTLEMEPGRGYVERISNQPFSPYTPLAAPSEGGSSDQNRTESDDSLLITESWSNHDRRAVEIVPRGDLVDLPQRINQNVGGRNFGGELSPAQGNALRSLGMQVNGDFAVEVPKPSQQSGQVQGDSFDKDFVDPLTESEDWEIPGQDIIIVRGAPEIAEAFKSQLKTNRDGLKSDLIHVDNFTFDGTATTQRATDEQLVDDLLADSADQTQDLNAPKGRLRGQSTTHEFEAWQLKQAFVENVLRAGFQVDKQTTQAEIQYQIALQRFGLGHPAVAALKAQVEVLKKFQEDQPAALEQIESMVTKAEINGLSKEVAGKLRDRIEKKKKLFAPKSWKRVKATGNSSRLIVGDKDELDLTGMQVHVQVDGFRARVLIDYFFYNDRDRQLEGNFKMRLPDDASLYYFAFGQSAYDFSPNGPMAGGEFVAGSDQYVSLGPAEIGLARQDAWKNVKEARMVPREKAAFAYSQTVRRRVDPALVEWSGAGIFNARVFPLMPKKLHRIVMGYDVNLAPTDDGLAYKLELPDHFGQCRVDLGVTDFENGKWELQLQHHKKDQNAEPTVWESSKNNGGVVSQKRFRFDTPQWHSMRLTAKAKSSLVLESPKSAKGKFFATQFKVDLPVEKNSGNEHAVFVVDTSLSSRPEKFNVWLDLMKATLNNNRDDLKQFAVLFFDVDCRFWRSEWSENTTDNVQDLLADCHQIGLEGATNLHGAILELGDAPWLNEGDATADVFLLSDGAANWGETNLRLIQQEYTSLNLGSLFAYQTGLNGTAISNLRYMAGSTGGAVFSVASENEIEAASTAHRNKPWELNTISAEGASDLMTAGRAQWIYPGQQLTVVGRGSLSSDLKLELTQGEDKKTVSIAKPIGIKSELADRMYGHVAVGQLESLADTLFDVSAAYARHFRITGQTCSLLMLESEADYRRFDIKPKEDWFVVQSKSASEIVGKTLEKVAESLADPKAQLLQWIERLENMPGIKFTMPTALKIAMDGMAIEAIDSRLEIADDSKDDWNKKYVKNLSAEKLDTVLIGAEMQRRRKTSLDAALRAYSNLIESNPGDWVAARDVAFTAMDLQRPAAAYHLLRKVIHSRPYEGTTYAALGQCLDQMNKADMAMIFYELALGAKFQNQGPDFHRIVATQYRSLLNRVVHGELESGASEYAVARIESLAKISSLEKSDLVVMMMWNTDQTDVDLHVVEPGGEECSYQNRSTKSGGKITSDDTDGFGPEMYSTPVASDSNYEVKIKFYSSNQNRTKVTNKAYLTVYENFGSKNEKRTREVISVSEVGKKELVKTIRPNSKVEGVCLRVKDDIAAISVGSDDGMKAGLVVVFYRDDQIVGRGEITRARTNMSAVRLLSGANVEEGDLFKVE